MIRIEKYLPPTYHTQLQLRQAIVAEIQKKHANTAMQQLKTQHFGLEQLPHLKKIKKQEENSQLVDLLLGLEEDREKLQILLKNMKQLIVKLKTVPVPFTSPNTKEQYLEWSKYWPINFIQQEIYKPVKHQPQQVTLLETLAKKEEALIVFDEKQELFSIKTELKCQEGTIRHPVMNMLEQWPKTEAFAHLPLAYYLTKLRLFCKIPLCGMCAMALVHSRLDRIYFYSLEIPQTPGQILCCQKLNHKVIIFQVNPLPQ